MSSHLKKKSKQIFHTPEKVGEAKPIPMTGAMRGLSVLSLVIQAGLTVFAVYGAVTRKGELIALSDSFVTRSGYLLLFWPVLGWIVTLGLRLACRFLPLEMWRLSRRVKKGVLMTEGRLLKMAVLLLELEIALCLLYITVSIYLGYAPVDAVVLVWAAILLGTVFVMGNQAVKVADGELEP